MFAIPRSMARFTTMVSGLALLTVPAWSQQWSPSASQDWCDRGDPKGDCEVRSTTLPAGSSLLVDAGGNGGISVEGYDGSEVLVQVKVRASKGADLEDVQIATTADSIEASGPRRGNWAASFRIQVPRDYDLDLRTSNGGLDVEGVEGTLRLKTSNGGISLADVGGDVKGRTSNGGLSVTLAGDTWYGEGLDVSTSNGGVKLRLPENYSAELVTGTVNGRLEFDMPVTVQGKIGKEIRATLGSGGPTVRVQTTNGSVKVESAS